jgi:crotonobetainyl-CoA:carnitine CoA-transferase CaiB-like acyl-CoA transferase
VMGPTCGMVLADLGAEVIKVEPLAGDSTRSCWARAPASSHVQPQQEEPGGGREGPRGREIVLRLVAGADVFSENFKGGTMERLGLGAEALAA